MAGTSPAVTETPNHLQLSRRRRLGTPGRLESVKKTHQVARVGMGTLGWLLPTWAVKMLGSDSFAGLG